MPKEQPGLSEHSPCATSTKNAKDKSNSMALLAMRNGRDAGGSRGRGSHCSSEKDSGYSDGSDWQQTDVEDQHSNKSQSGGSEGAETPQPGQNQEPGRANPENPTPMLAGRELPPVYIIKSVVLNQADKIQKRGQLLRTNESGETNSSAAPRLILCQQPILLPSSQQLRKPLSRKPSVTGKKTNGTYLPIFNSYPRIAPHPCKKPPDKLSLSDESQNLSKRVCTEHKSDNNTPVTRIVPEQHLYRQPKLAVSASGQTCSSSTRASLSSSSSTAAPSNRSSSSVSSMHTTTPSLSSSSSSSLTNSRLHRSATAISRHRRFLNTVDILRQSGLLDITLRTKELLRQSNATEQDIAQLRRHTELLCQAANDPSCSLNGIAALERLYRAMADSSSYPSLKLLQNLQVPSRPDSSQPERNAACNASGPVTAESSDVPQSRPLSTMLHANQNCPIYQQSQSEQCREGKANEESTDKVNFLSPDSSTD